MRKPGSSPEKIDPGGIFQRYGNTQEGKEEMDLEVEDEATNTAGDMANAGKPEGGLGARVDTTAARGVGETTILQRKENSVEDMEISGEEENNRANEEAKRDEKGIENEKETEGEQPWTTVTHHGGMKQTETEENEEDDKPFGAAEEGEIIVMRAEFTKAQAEFKLIDKTRELAEVIWRVDPKARLIGFMDSNLVVRNRNQYPKERHEYERLHMKESFARGGKGTMIVGMKVASTMTLKEIKAEDVMLGYLKRNGIYLREHKEQSETLTMVTFGCVLMKIATLEETTAVASGYRKDLQAQEEATKDESEMREGNEFPPVECITRRLHANPKERGENGCSTLALFLRCPKNEVTRMINLATTAELCSRQRGVYVSPTLMREGQIMKDSIETHNMFAAGMVIPIKGLEDEMLEEIMTTSEGRKTVMQLIMDKKTTADDKGREVDENVVHSFERTTRDVKEGKWCATVRKRFAVQANKFIDDVVVGTCMETAAFKGRRTVDPDAIVVRSGKRPQESKDNLERTLDKIAKAAGDEKSERNGGWNKWPRRAEVPSEITVDWESTVKKAEAVAEGQRSRYSNVRKYNQVVAGKKQRNESDSQSVNSGVSAQSYTSAQDRMIQEQAQKIAEMNRNMADQAKKIEAMSEEREKAQQRHEEEIKKAREETEARMRATMAETIEQAIKTALENKEKETEAIFEAMFEKKMRGKVDAMEIDCTAQDTATTTETHSSQSRSTPETMSTLTDSAMDSAMESAREESDGRRKFRGKGLNPAALADKLVQAAGKRTAVTTPAARTPRSHDKPQKRQKEGRGTPGHEGGQNQNGMDLEELSHSTPTKLDDRMQVATPQRKYSPEMQGYRESLNLTNLSEWDYNKEDEKVENMQVDSPRRKLEHALETASKGKEKQQKSSLAAALESTKRNKTQPSGANSLEQTDQEAPAATRPAGPQDE